MDKAPIIETSDNDNAKESNTRIDDVAAEISEVTEAAEDAPIVETYNDDSEKESNTSVDDMTAKIGEATVAAVDAPRLPTMLGELADTETTLETTDSEIDNFTFT